MNKLKYLCLCLVCLCGQGCSLAFGLFLLQSPGPQEVLPAAAETDKETDKEAEEKEEAQTFPLDASELDSEPSPDSLESKN